VGGKVREIIMNFFKRNKTEELIAPPVYPVPATADSRPYSILKDYSPFRLTEYELYTSLREAVPIIDAAIDKTVRLMGGFTVETGNKEYDRELEIFMNSVATNGGNHGIFPFITTYINEMLTYGEAVGEIVLDKSKTKIAALYNASLKHISIVADNSPLNLKVVRNDCNKAPVRYRELIIPTLLNPVPGTVKGTSIMRGLPFVSEILLTIFNSVKKNWERVGDVRFAVTYKPDNNSPAITGKQAKKIAEEWSR
jgi:hypothetical protein